MAEVTFNYGQKFIAIPLICINPNIVAEKFNINLSELYLTDSKQRLILVDNESFDAELSSTEVYTVYDNSEKPSMDMALLSPLLDQHITIFKKSIQILFPAEKINSCIKLQGLAMVTLKANDVSLIKGNYKYVKNTSSLRAAVHNLTSTVTTTYLETSSYAGEIHSGLSNILKGIPDMLKEIDNPNSDSAEMLQDLEKWMTETLEECYSHSEKAAQQTKHLLNHINELERALIASLGPHKRKTTNKEENEEILEQLKREQQRNDEKKHDAKKIIYQLEMLNVDAQQEYTLAQENYNKKRREIFELKFQIEQAKMNDAKNEDILRLLRECISEINEVKNNWAHTSYSITIMKNTLKVEKEAKHWELATQSLKLDLNKRYLITNLLQFLAIGYKIDYWVSIQNRIIKEYLLPIASTTTNLFGSRNITSIKNDTSMLIERATNAVKSEQSKAAKEYESDLLECLSLYSAATIFKSECIALQK